MKTENLIFDLFFRENSLHLLCNNRKALEADLKNGVDFETAMLDYYEAAIGFGFIDEDDFAEFKEMLENMPEEELEMMKAMLPAEIKYMIKEIESYVDDPETVMEMDFMKAACVKMAVCGGEHLYEIVWRNAPVSIKTPSVTEIKHGETLILHAEYEEIPEGAKLVWTVTGEGVEIVPSEDGTTCAVISVDKGTATVKLSVVAENGKNVVDENGNELGSEQTINSKSNLWLKIVSFFKNLFRMNRTIEQTIVIR